MKKNNWTVVDQFHKERYGVINLKIHILVELYCIFFFFLTERRNGISKQHEKQEDYLLLLYICALQYMDCGRGQIKQQLL